MTAEVEEAEKQCVEVEEDEVFLVMRADAIVDPDAMVVHAENAFSALLAVMRSWGFPSIVALMALSAIKLRES
jgi:hypothetical protein